MLYGFRICLWSVLRTMAHGRCFAPTNVPEWQMCMVLNSWHCMRNTREKEKDAKRCLRAICGFKYWTHKWKPAHPICYTKMHAIANRINRIWERLNRRICVVRLSNIPTVTKLPYVIWRVLHYQCL